MPVLLGWCAVFVLFKQLGEHFRVGNIVAALNASVVDSKDRIDIFHALVTDICHCLDLVRCIFDLVIGHVKLQLLRAALDGIPASQSASDRNVSAHAEVFGPQNLICGRVGKDGLGVDTSLKQGTQTQSVPERQRNILPGTLTLCVNAQKPVT